MIKKIIGTICIGAGLLLGITSTGLLFTEGIFSLFVMLIIAFPLFMLGQWLRIGAAEFRKKALKFIAIFVQVAFIVPSIFLLFNEYSKMKSGTFSREGFLWFQSTSSPNIAMVGTILLIVLVLSLMPKILFGWIYGGKALNVLIIATVILSALFLYVTWNDYKGIHETEGIVVSKWSGGGETISWTDIEEVKIIPFVKKRISSKYSQEPVFAWRFEFQTKNGEKVVFEQLDLSEFNLKQSNKVKNQVEKENIPVVMESMDDKTKKWYEIELEVDKLDRTAFDEFFTR